MAGRVTIESLATYLPDPVPVAVAVTAGRLTEQDAAASGYAAITVAPDYLAPPQMAVTAARRALHRASLPANELASVAHAWTYHQGHDFWSPAHYIAAELGASRAVPVGVQQMCNGGGAALELAVDRLLAEPGRGPALVTTADRFGAPGFDRWRGDYGVLYGDGATAAVLTTTAAHPCLELLATGTSVAADLERMHRGEDPFSAAPRMTGPVDVRRTKKSFLADVGREAFVGRMQQRIRDVVRAALADAGLSASDVGPVAVPRLGPSSLDEVYRPALRDAGVTRPLDLGEGTGHLGAGDVVANLAALVDDGLLRPGGIAVALSAGAGFTWTCLVVRRPDPRKEITDD